MNVTVEVVSEETSKVAVDDDGTYVGPVRAVDLSPHGVTVPVDDCSVPEDQSVEVDRVKALHPIRDGQSAVWKIPRETVRPAESASARTIPANQWP